MAIGRLPRSSLVFAHALLVLAYSCRRAEPSPPPPPHGSAKGPSTERLTKRSGSLPGAVSASPSTFLLDASQLPDFGEPDFPSIDPPIPPHKQDMEDHSDRSGWLADSSEFGYCMESGGSGATLCQFFSSAGKLREKVDDFNHANWEIDAKRTALLKQRIARYSAPRVRFPFARDLTITWQTNAGPSDEQPGRIARLRVGARVRGSSTEAFPISISAGKSDFEIHVEALALSPDASSLAVLSHSFAGEFADTFTVRVLATAKLAEEAYNSAGLSLHRRGDYAGAAPLFHKAAYADVTAPLPMYNLACSLARLREAHTEKALELAIARGGQSVKEKARKDADFELVRGEPWFDTLTR